MTDAPAGVSSFKWLSDGSMIAFTAADGLIPAEVQDAQKKNGILIVGQDLKKQRLRLISLADLSHGPGSGRPLTGGEIHVGSPEVPEAYNWSPHGNAIVFSHSPSPQPNDWPGTRLALLNLADSSIRPLGGQDTVAFDPHFSPDGRWISYKVYDTPAWEWSSVVHVLPLEGGNSYPLAETRDRHPDLLGWSTDGKWLYYLETVGANHCLVALPADGSPPMLLFEWEGCIENVRLNQSRSAMGFTLQTPSQPPEAYLTPLDDISPVQMSQINAEFCQIPIGQTEVIRWRSTDGLEIEGLLTYPVDYEKGRRTPGGSSSSACNPFMARSPPLLPGAMPSCAAMCAAAPVTARLSAAATTATGGEWMSGICWQVLTTSSASALPSRKDWASPVGVTAAT